MDISIGYNSDKGLKRSKNEDSYAVLNRTELSGKLDGLLVVADGMGGLRGGEVASRTVVETIPRVVLETLAHRNGSSTSLDAGIVLRDTIIQANGIIWRMRRFENSPDTRGMGTTCVAAIVQDETLTVANVGDSRAYLLRDGRLTLLTTDHSEVFEQVQAGTLTLDQANKSQFRNIVTRGVGLGQEVLPDITVHALQEGDTILLCTDGLTTELSDEHIAAGLAHGGDAQEACDRLVNAALKHGGRDNVTVVAMRYGPYVASTEVDTHNDWDGDELDTDPVQEWRRAPRMLRDDEDEDDDDMSAPATGHAVLARGRTFTINAVTQLIIALLILACLVEGALLFNPIRRQQPAVIAPTPVVQRPKPTDVQLDYGPVMTLSTGGRTLQDDVLEVDPAGNALVVTINGNLMGISPTGKETRLSGNFPSLADKHRPPAATAHADVALDASGNLYHLSADDKRIYIFNFQGVRINAGLGTGDLTAPTRIAVDNLTGSIYILDGHKLKHIAAKPAR